MIQPLRDSLTANVVYSNAQYKAIYEEVLTWIKNNIDYAIQEAELDKETAVTNTLKHWHTFLVRVRKK